MSNPRSTPAPVRNTPLPTSLIQDVGAIPAIADNPKLVSDDEYKKWIEEIYQTGLTISDDELRGIYELYKYKGFNREDVIKLLKVAAKDAKTAIHLIIICSLKGPQAAAKTVLANGKTPLQMGIPASGGQGKQVLTCSKISAATADLAAFYMKKINVPKRINVDCPAWLQFPTAGSIKLPEDLRRQHREFAEKFSKLIGGLFQEGIYEQMIANAYLDSRLHLF
jgi:hypothetical protein